MDYLFVNSGLSRLFKINFLFLFVIFFPLWNFSATSQEAINSTTKIAAASKTTAASHSQCKFPGSGYRAIPLNAGCFEWSRTIESGVAFNDPTDVVDGLPSIQYTGRSDIDLKWFKRTQIGTLSSFIRLQAQYDPGVSEDLILGAVERDFAVGLDAFQLKLDNSRGQFKLGKIENAGSVFIADGFTRRGAESLDARSALGVSYQTRIGGIDAVGSISDGNNTVSGSRANLPNFGLGVRKKFAHSAHHLGWLL